MICYGLGEGALFWSSQHSLQHLTFDNKINKLYERCCRLILGNKTSTFQEIFVKDSSISDHITIIQTLAIEMYQVANDIAQELTKKVLNFHGEIGCKLRDQIIFRRPLVDSVYNGMEKVSFLDPKSVI